MVLLTPPEAEAPGSSRLLSVLQPINVVSWSPCGRFLAAGAVGGSLMVWDVNSKLCVER